MESITFDEVFKIWFDNEFNRVEGRDLLPVAKQKGFSSIAEWRLTNALRFGLDNLDWTLDEIQNPGEVLPEVVIGPYRGWSIQKDITFFDNQLETSFKEALEIPEFFNFCKDHDRILPLSKNFPLPTSIILVRKPDGKLIHIEGGHRICAIAFAQKVGQPIDFAGKPPITAAIANIDEDFLESLKEKAKQGTEKTA